jgi:cytochrome c-type biogenesis protein CcmH
MLEFLLAALTTATVAALLFPLLRSPIEATNRLDNDLAVYRDQLAELDRERAAGTLPEADATAARLEIERRILTAADRDTREGPALQLSLNRFLAPALCLLIPLFALGLYLQIGHPGLPSAPFRGAPFKPSNALPEAPASRVAEVISAARLKLAQNPDDPQALSALGEALTVEAGGVVTPAALEALNKALARNPDDPRTIFYLGLHEAQSGDSKAALRRWQELLARSPPDAPWLPTLRAEIERLAKAAGVASGAPAPATGPTQDQVQAMQNLPPAERQQAIRNMVDGLAAKLQDNPNDRDGWLRLARARMVLNEPDKAADAFARADALTPLDTRLLADWAEAHVRQVQPGGAPSPAAVAVLQRLEKAEPGNALALFYLGAADFAQGNRAEAARRWKALLAKLPPDAPIRGMLEQKIKEAE